MNKKIILAALLAVLVSVAAYFGFAQKNDDFSDVFLIDAVYIESENIVEIRFADSTQNTDSVILEILGMEESFQRTHLKNEFTETVSIAEPAYGWAVHPVTLVITHGDLGVVHAKTEIRPQGEPAPSIIFGIQ